MIQVKFAKGEHEYGQLEMPAVPRVGGMIWMTGFATMHIPKSRVVAVWWFSNRLVEVQLEDE